MTPLARFFLVLFFLLAAPTLAPAQEEASLQDLAGIPVMDGLEEDLEARIVFDKAEGRIIHVVLSGNKSRTEVETFYQETLFQLGWLEAIVETGNLVFARDGERLILTITALDPLVLEIDLAPVSDSS